MGKIPQNIPNPEPEKRMEYDLKIFLYQFFSFHQLDKVIEYLNRIVTRETTNSVSISSQIKRSLRNESPLYGFVAKTTVSSATSEYGKSGDMTVVFYPEIDKFIEILELVLKLIYYIKDYDPELLGSSYLGESKLLFTLFDTMQEPEVEVILEKYRSIIHSKTKTESEVDPEDFKSQYLDNKEYIGKVAGALELLRAIRLNIVPQQEP